MTQHKAQLQEFRNILEHGGGLPGDDARRLCLEMAEENERLQAIVVWYETFCSVDDWHEDDGYVLWWRLPVVEPPYCGTPRDDTWLPNYYTHFTPLVRNSVLSQNNDELEAAGTKQPTEGKQDE